MKDKILLYTAITGNYEQPRDDIRVETSDLFKLSVRDARMHKCLTPDFDKYDYSIWIDGNTSLKVSPEFLIKELGDADILVYSHWRDCVYDEGRVVEKIVDGKHGEFEAIMYQMIRYKEEGYPNHNGLAATTYVIRRHNKAVAAFNNLWWAEISKGSERDQLSFNYAIWKLGNIKLKYFEEKHFDIHRDNTYFNYVLHNEKLTQ